MLAAAALVADDSPPVLLEGETSAAGPAPAYQSTPLRND